MESLTSLKNPRVRQWAALKDRRERREQGCFLVEGRRSVTDALASPFPLKALLVTDPQDPFIRPGLPVFQLPEHVMAHVCDTRSPQGVAAVMGMRDTRAEGARLVILDGLQDPGNVGTILRTADAAGLDGLILSADCADPFSPKVLRATMGSVFHLPVEIAENLPDRLRALQSDGWVVFSSQLDGMPFREGAFPPPDRWCLVIGNEGNGVRESIRCLADRRVCLPMRGRAESLNAGVAAGIMMYMLLEET